MILGLFHLDEASGVDSSTDMELARKKNRKSRTLRAADWDKQKDTIQTLFLTEDRPLREVRQTLAEKHGFEAR